MHARTTHYLPTYQIVLYKHKAQVPDLPVPVRDAGIYYTYCVEYVYQSKLYVYVCMYVCLCMYVSVYNNM